MFDYILALVVLPILAAAYYIGFSFALLGIVLLRETNKYIRVEQITAREMTEAQFAVVCQRSMSKLFDHNGAMVFLYPFLLFIQRTSKPRKLR